MTPAIEIWLAGTLLCMVFMGIVLLGAYKEADRKKDPRTAKALLDLDLAAGMLHLDPWLAIILISLVAWPYIFYLEARRLWRRS